MLFLFQSTQFFYSKWVSAADLEGKVDKETSHAKRRIREFLVVVLCIGQIEASTCPPPPPGIPRAFDTFAVPGRREFDYQSLPEGGEFDPHALGVGNLNCALDFM